MLSAAHKTKKRPLYDARNVHTLGQRHVCTPFSPHDPPVFFCVFF